MWPWKCEELNSTTRAAACTLAARVGADSQSAWQPSILLVGHIYPCVDSGLAIKASWDTPTVACGDTWLTTITSRHYNHTTFHAHRCQLAVKVLIPYLMFDQTLIRSRHHPSLSPPSIIDADPFFILPLCLPQRARFTLFLSPNLFWLPDVFLCSFLWSFREKQSGYPVCSFLWLFWGTADCRPDSQATCRQGRKDTEIEKIKSKWSHVLCHRSLRGSFNKINALNSSRVLQYCSQLRLLARSFSCIPALLAERYALRVRQEWCETWRQQALKNYGVLFIS